MKRPLIWSDFPDPDVIRVGDTYYMVSTTMHMFPGGDIYRSKDLLSWELCCHMYGKLDETPGQKLEGSSIYGQGMWAACIRHHGGLFHVFFVCNDTRRSYHFYAENPEGPWKWNHIEGFYHDCSVLFDDGRVFVVHGNRTIRLTELNSDLTAPKENGIDQVIIEDLPPEGVMLGFEGSHLYKINGRYYLFFIHWPHGGMRTEACFTAESITGPWTGRDVLSDDMGFFGQGVAQGGIVETPDGEWKGVLFQDHGAVGRVPVLCDVKWKNGFPVFNVSDIPEQKTENIEKLYAAKEDFTNPLSDMWQFNHQPALDAYTVGNDGLTLKLQKASCLENARNTLTQRAFGPKMEVRVTVDAGCLQEGGRCGLGLLQGCFAGLFIEKSNGKYILKTERRIAAKKSFRSDEPVTIDEITQLEGSRATLVMYMDFEDMRDEVSLYAEVNGKRITATDRHRLFYRLDHFMGARIVLYGYDTASKGSRAVFTDYAARII